MRELISTCLYVGYVPFAPGTLGSLLALAAGLALHRAAGGMAAGSVALAGALALQAPGARLAAWAQEFFRRRDPPEFVLDEFAGCLLSLAPGMVFSGDAEVLLLGGIPFVLFRLFGIFRPGPIASVALLRAGWGMMLDDLVAGSCAGACSAALLGIFG